jgi:hypothetical protein
MPQQKYDPMKPKRRPLYPDDVLYGNSGKGPRPYQNIINDKGNYVQTGIKAIDNYSRNAKIDELGSQAQAQVRAQSDYYKKNPSARKAQLEHTARAAVKNKPMSKLLKMK